MKVTFHAALALVMSAAAVGSSASLNGASPIVRPSIAAPAAFVVRQVDPKFQQEIDAARAKAIDFLKTQQKDGEWSALPPDFSPESGATVLVALALLEAGVAPADSTLSRTIARVEKLEPKTTFVVSLQTQILTRLDA